MVVVAAAVGGGGGGGVWEDVVVVVCEYGLGSREDTFAVALVLLTELAFELSPCATPSAVVSVGAFAGVFEVIRAVVGFVVDEEEAESDFDVRGIEVDLVGVAAVLPSAAYKENENERV